MGEKVSPKGFDFQGFISRATRPRSGTQIYADGQALGELRKIGRMIQLEKPIEDLTRQLSKKSLYSQYFELWEKVKASAMDIYLEGHTFQETQELCGDLYPVEGHSEDAQRKRDQANMILIADSIVTDTGEKLSTEEVEQLRHVIGERQWKEILHAYTEACTSAITPDAEFLQHASTPENGKKSSQR